MAQVFVCYDREDRDFAEVVQAKLEKAGHTTSMDLDILNAGDDWQDKLDAAIRNSQALVVIMTPNARASDYVAYEWAFALGTGVTVIPLEVIPTTFSPRLDSLHRLDFTEKTRQWEVLLAEVQKAQSVRRGPTLPIPAGASPVVEGAIRAIDSLIPEERLAGVRTLAQTNEPAARDALVQALKHPVRGVRIEAARLFPERTDPCIVPGLIDWYREELQQWADQGYRGQRPGLADQLLVMGGAAVAALLSALRELTDDPVDQATRVEILDALGQIKDPSVIPTLVEALKDPNGDIRLAAAKALGQLGELSAATSLRSVLSDENRYVREEAVASLGLLKDAAVVPELIRILAEDGKRMRQAAATALGKIAAAESVPPLIEALKDEDTSVKTATVGALGQLGDARAIPYLRPLVDGRSPSIGDDDIELMSALIRLKDTESFPAIEQRVIAFTSGTVPLRVCQELAHSGDIGIQSLIRIVGSAGDEHMRDSVIRAAAQALESIRSPEATAALKAWRRKQD